MVRAELPLPVGQSTRLVAGSPAESVRLPRTRYDRSYHPDSPSWSMTSVAPLSTRSAAWGRAVDGCQDHERAAEHERRCLGLGRRASATGRPWKARSRRTSAVAGDASTALAAGAIASVRDMVWISPEWNSQSPGNQSLSDAGTARSSFSISRRIASVETATISATRNRARTQTSCSIVPVATCPRQVCAAARHRR